MSLAAAEHVASSVVRQRTLAPTHHIVGLRRRRSPLRVWLLRCLLQPPPLALRVIALTRQHNEEMYKKVSTNSVQQSDATSR